GDAKAPGDHLGIGGTYRADLTGRLMLFNGNARDQVVAGRTVIPTGTWNHAVVIRTKNHLRAFLNGETKPEIDADIDSVLPAGSAGLKNFFLGARSDNFAPLQGHVAYFALFDRALSDSEAKQLHAASGQPVGTPEATAATAPRPASEPLSSERSLSKIHVPKDFRVELVAAEPQVLDPVAFDWDWAGRLWVVEMADYPLGLDGKGKPGGRIRVLEDHDRDGRYEQSHLFADGLNFPNGILTWRDGVLVTAAPEILFLRDTDGDGVADQQEVLLTGFQEGNQQLRLNGLRWGLDNWVYCASGGHHANYGTQTKVTSLRSGKTYEIGSRDFRFQPDTGAVELESGPSQFGRNRDPWGHWFGVQNAHPLWHYVIADRYLARNPYVPSPKPVQQVVPPGITEVHPASPPEKRFHNFQEAGHFTSACSGMIYGDARLFAAGAKMHAFTCEPFHNLVQHNIVKDDGVSYRSERPVGEGRFDFFASEDRWCRPVMVRTGPDGGLWIADMYRYMIEHPDWLPPEGKAELLPHYRLGEDRGRIYRIVPADDSPAQDWLPANADTPALVAGLDSSNDWLRDKAQQLLVWRRDAAAVPLVEKLLRTSQRPETRVQALWTLEGLDGLSSQLLIAALRDSHPRVRENAVRLAEERQEADVIAAALQRTSDLDAKVCLQLALSIGEWPRPEAGQALVELAQRFHRDAFMQAAIMSSSLAHASVFAEGIARSDSEVQAAFREPLVRQSVGRKDLDALAVLLSQALAAPAAERANRLDDFLLTLQRVGASLEELAGQNRDNKLAPLIGQLDKAFETMAAVARDEQAAPEERLAAARLLCRLPEYRATGVKQLGQWLDP
ncbi:MAG: PVC-type heme-binding CxxCH protein, partial [Aureliella sp.]